MKKLYLIEIYIVTSLLLASNACAGSQRLWVVENGAAEQPSSDQVLADKVIPIIESHDLHTLYIEGAKGDMTLSRPGYKTSRADASRLQELLLEQTITPAEYIQLSSKKLLRLWGVDDTTLFERLKQLERSIPVGREELKERERLKQVRDIYLAESVIKDLKNTKNSGAILWLSRKMTPVLKQRLEEAGIKPDFLRVSDAEPNNVTYLPRRPVRAELAYELIQDRVPRLWRLGETFGLTPEQNLQNLFGSLGSQASLVLKKEEGPVRFSWADTFFPSALAAEPGMIVPPLQDKDHDREKYEAFKVLAQKTQLSKMLEPDQVSGLVVQMVQDYEKALESVNQQKNRSKKFPFNHPRWMALWYRVVSYFDGTPGTFPVDQENIQKIVSFLSVNVTKGGMPLSYKAPEGYWADVDSPMDEVDSVMERLLVNYSVSIYDAALWQLALMTAGTSSDAEKVSAHTGRLLSGASGDLVDIRAFGETFKYGDEKKELPRDHGYFFRIIVDQYIEVDPLDGKTTLEEFPNFSLLHHEDWKPITGEQAWATIIGPLQTAYLRDRGHILGVSQEMRLAKSILPAVEAMRSPIGAIYHVPHGTHGKHPQDISSENNASMYAALGILEKATQRSDPSIAAKAHQLRRGMEDYFKEFGFDNKNKIFYQGGFYIADKFMPARIFAADCQTWGINALGPEWIDRTFGEGTAYQIWQNTRERAGYFDEKGVLRGIGFTDSSDVHSVEWTAGAILTTRILAEHYRRSDPERTYLLEKDGVTMRFGLEEFKTTSSTGATSYLYANKRYFIPWGWWANPIPSLASSAWVVLIDEEFNPFELGGGEKFQARQR